MIAARGFDSSIGSSAAVRRIGPSKFVATIASASANRPTLHQLGSHNASVENHYVQGRIITLHLLGEANDRVALSDIDHDGLHARIGRHRFFQRFLSAAGNNHLVPLGVKSLGQTSANPPSTAGNQDSVVRHLHEALPLSTTPPHQDTNAGGPTSV